MVPLGTAPPLKIVIKYTPITMTRLEDFKTMLGIKEITLNQFTEGKRAFASIKVGAEKFDIYLKEGTDVKKPLFITDNEKGFFIHNAKEALKTIVV